MGILSKLPHILIRSFTKRGFKRYWSKSSKIAKIQEKYLIDLINENTDTQFGINHGFKKIKSVTEFQQNIPLTDYEYYQSYISEITRGKTEVLTRNAVQKLVPTSGTGGFNKYIPYTKTTTLEFNIALNVWMHSLYREYPTIMAGRAFWVISPATNLPTLESVVPVGFENDSSYFGSIGAKLIDNLMVFPPEIQKVASPENNFYLSCLYLLCESNLTLISIWNPTYIIKLLSYIVSNKSTLVQSIGSGIISLPDCSNYDKGLELRIKKDEKRAAKINSIIADNNIRGTNWQQVWPKLTLISCWTDAWAATIIPQIRELFPTVSIQGKGLLATECAVTIPIMGMHLPAFQSHFFEFIETDTKHIKLLHQLEIGKLYEVFVTTGSGLYRYRLNDMVRVLSHYNHLPNLEFIGKSNIVSDLVGEKLSEPIVSAVLSRVRIEHNLTPEAFFLSPCMQGESLFYTLYTDSTVVSVSIANTVDEALKQVFYYGHARGINQLEGIKLYSLTQNGVNYYLDNIIDKAQTGTSKQLALITQLNLYEKLEGSFIK